MKKQVAMILSAAMVLSMPVLSFAETGAKETEKEPEAVEESVEESVPEESMLEEVMPMAEGEEEAKLLEEETEVQIGAFTVKLPAGWYLKEDGDDRYLESDDGDISIMVSSAKLEDLKKEMNLETEDTEEFFDAMEKNFGQMFAEEEEEDKEAEPALKLADFTLNDLAGRRVVWDTGLEDLFKMSMDLTMLSDGEDVLLIGLQEFEVMGDFGQAEMGEENESEVVLDADRALNTILFSARK